VHSLELDGASGVTETIIAARRKAVKELVGLTDPHELSEKLKSLESNKIVFSGETRGIMKVSRVLIDTYIAAHEECEEGGRHTHDNGCAHASHKTAAEKVMARELAADPKAASAFASIAEALKDKDPDEIQRTLREASRQLAADSARITKDILHVGRVYLKPDNIANVLISTLPLISWEYRWAMALGLGAWSARRAGAHAFFGMKNLVTGRFKEARHEGAETFRALKRAGAEMLLIGFSPALAGLPALLLPPVTFALNKAYGAVTQTLGDMLEQEEQKPGSTPLSKSIGGRVKGFFTKNQDSLASMGTEILTKLVPSTVTSVLAEVTSRVSLTKIRALGAKAKGLGVSVTKRFNFFAHGEPGAAKPAFSREDTSAILGATRYKAEAEKTLRDAYAQVAAIDHAKDIVKPGKTAAKTAEPGKPAIAAPPEPAP
jgi:hypothetical protein